MSFFSVKKFIVLFELVNLIFAFSFEEAKAACNTAPTVAGPIYAVGKPGDNMGYSISVRNNDDISCVAASRTFNLTSIKLSATATWTDSFESGTLTVNKGGGTGFTTYFLQSPAGAATGIYNFTITASDGFGSNTVDGRHAVSLCEKGASCASAFCGGSECVKFTQGRYLIGSLLQTYQHLNCDVYNKECIYDYSNIKQGEVNITTSPSCSWACGTNDTMTNANSLGIWAVVLTNNLACPVVPLGCIGLTQVVECLANSDCASNSCDLFTNTCITPPACANLSCQAANAALPCACGTATADVANPWCCAGNNAIYNAKALCQVGACTCVSTCATGPNCRAVALADANVTGAVCCGAGESCYQCKAGYSWDGSACMAVAPLLPPDACGTALGLFCNPVDNASDFYDAIVIAIKYLLSFIALVTLFFIVISGIKYLTSFGNEEKMKSAKDGLTFAIIGLILALMAYAILEVIIKVLN